MLKYSFDLFLFSSCFIAGCALLMVVQTNQLLYLQYDVYGYLVFVFFSTLCSYNFHWYLSADATSENARVRWTLHHKKLHLVLTAIGAIVSAWYFFHFIEHWFWLGGAVLLTFLYSAPKLRFGPFAWLSRIAVGKTLFLAFVWMYVTTFLPIAIDNHHWHPDSFLFCTSRFLLIYAICIIFDYRDRDYDRKAGIRSMITYFNERGIDNLFGLSIAGFAVSTIGLYFYGFSALTIVLLLIPGAITTVLYPVAKKNFSDYLYYFVLDGLMMFSSLLTIFISNK
ncbi:UbiA family prenyltransferase [Longitalea arenae]|uniref:UbiA family prenyltransferase n=1 Tax=Longitalea arenae TaxID=2812558 RepID=UPI001968055F|nr:UbiA family prenyltransferase [Longitalea arenae]